MRLLSWTTERPGGFNDADIAALDCLVPELAAAFKNLTVARIAETLVETYLGRDAGRRVLKGAIARGIADKIRAVLWFSDLRASRAWSTPCRRNRSCRSSTTMPTHWCPPSTSRAAMF